MRRSMVPRGSLPGLEVERLRKTCLYLRTAVDYMTLHSAKVPENVLLSNETPFLKIDPQIKPPG